MAAQAIRPPGPRGDAGYDVAVAST